MRPFRNELKFVVSQSQYATLRERWRRHLVKDPHTNAEAVTPILSQYYDTPSLSFYEEKLDGFNFRNKVRLRTYGYRFERDGLAFLEIKQRLGDRVRKIRQKISSLDSRHLEPESWTFDDPADRSAFGVLRERYQLRASAQVWYLRQAYASVVESDVRVTFDSCLTGLLPGERLDWEMMSDPMRKLLPETRVICEVKAPERLPRWVFSGVQAAELVQRPVPKYIMAVEKLSLHHDPRIYVSSVGSSLVEAGG